MARRATVFFLLLLCAIPSFAKEKYQQPSAIHLDKDGEKWAEKTLHKLSLEEKVGQLFMVFVESEFLNVSNPKYEQLRDSLNRYHIGSILLSVRAEGPFLYRDDPYDAAILVNRLQSDSKLPLLVAADYERGVSMRLNGVTVFPHAMAFGAAGKPEYSQAMGRITALEARAVGVQWNFFPDADVNSNPDNPIINTRSFGEDPHQVGDMVAAYIRGAHEGGMLTTAKHFPGHGDTGTDSHLGVAQVTGNAERLNAVELVPFRQAIQAGTDAVMVAHVSVPALESDPKRIATTSSQVVNGLLKKDLGFQGLVVSDAIDMAALTRLYADHIGRAAVEAFKAGNDVLVKPAALAASYDAMLDAVRKGEIPTSRIDASVLKILKTKASLDLHKARLVDTSAIGSLVGRPENLAQGQQIADDAITLVRDNGQVLPLKHSGTVNASLPYQTVEEARNDLVVVVFSEDVRSDSGRVLERQVKARAPDARVIYVDPRIAGPSSDAVLQAVDQARSVVAAIYVVPTAGKAMKASGGGLKNSIDLSDASGALLHKVLEHAAAKTVVLAMGSPYLAADFPEIQNYVCAFSNVSVSEIAAAKAVFGEIAIRGRLPVTIPRFAERGAGIQRQP